MVDAGRAIPWRAEVPFHVGIVGKQFAFEVEADVKGITIADTHELPVFPIGSETGNVAAWSHAITSVAIRIGLTWKELIFLPRGCGHACVHGGEVCVVASDEINPFAIGRGD